jgi:ribose transport system permease protein
MIDEGGQYSTSREPSAAHRTFESSKHFLPVLVVGVALFAVFWVAQPLFATPGNIRVLLVGISSLFVVSTGMTFVIISGGFDLSLAVIAGLTGYFLGTIVNLGVPGVLASVLTIIVGAVIGGLANGYFIGALGLSFFVVTLATMSGLTGVLNLWSNTVTLSVDDPFLAQVGYGAVFGAPTSVIVMVAVFAIALYLQQKTFFGRDVYAIGGNLVAARLSGIRVKRTIIVVYAFAGACAAVAGVIATGRIGAATPIVDSLLPLNAAAGVLLGGTKFTGGFGGVGGTAVGVIFIGVLQNGLSVSGVSSFWQQVATGVILLAAVLFDRLNARAVLNRFLRRT